MAYVNVKDWSVDQVTEWLKGLDNVILQYTTSFLNNGVNGHQLLNFRADDLEHLGVVTLGHQEIILEAVEHLRNFHYELDKENLQMLALRLSCASNSLFKELLLSDENCTKVQTQTMSDVHNIITTIKPLVCWLDRSPFRGDKDYMETKTQLLQLGFEMATSAHRDIFSEKPLRTIRDICEKLTKMADHIIQEISDPMILQPASLDLATLKKKEQELGFLIMPNNHALHQIAEIKFGTPAHSSTKIEEGDEIVQVNYQTVVGWQRKKVLLLLQESPPEIVLTLKKRPRHTKVYGQIYMKPYRLPSRKRAQPYSRWNENLSSPLFTIHDLPQIPIPKMSTEVVPQESENEISSGSDSEPPDSPLDGTIRMYPIKPRPVLQRRNTITGATPTTKRPYPAIEQYWELWKNEAASANSSALNIDSPRFDEDSMYLRDKSASCSHGLELNPPRPTTVIGLSQSRNNKSKEKSLTKKQVNFEIKDTKCCNISKSEAENVGFNSKMNEEKSVSVNSLSSLTNEHIAFIDEGRDITDRSSMVTEVQKEATEEEAVSDKIKPPEIPKCDAITITKDAVFADVHIHNIIKKFDEQIILEKKPILNKPKIYPRSQVKMPPEIPQKPDVCKKPVVPPRNVTTKVRGRLDKSHSTPAYDLTAEDNIAADGSIVETKTEIKEIEKSTVTETTTVTYTKKYELGIPIVEAVNTSLLETVDKQQDEIKLKSETIKPNEIIEEPEDVPPKPPPRTYGVIDLVKPVYPADSPKPANLLELTKNTINNQHSVSESPVTKNTFDFAEPKVFDNTVQYGKTINLDLGFHNAKQIDIKQACDNELTKNSKLFEPKGMSTPISKHCKVDFPESEKACSSFDLPKVSNDKISPTNSVVRAMIYSNKNKGGKKKNSLLAKRRKVSVSDVSPGDIQGNLYQRLRSKHTQNFNWEKRWFVLSGSCLYGFKSRDDNKASFLIILSGFTVAVANEVKSKSNAFKVYHTGTVFYFSAEDSESLMSWIEMITAATLHSDPKVMDQTVYSETDESDTEKSKCTEKPQESIKKFGSLKKFTAKKAESSSPSGSTSLDRKWFFNKSNSAPKNSVPVPTAQFRSYRKIRSTNSSTGSVQTGNFTSHIPFFASRLEIQTLSQSQNVSVPNLAIDNKNVDVEKEPARKSQSKKNYIHASNPSLCNVSEFNLPTFNKIRTGQHANENLAGFVTLEELMNRQTEERKLNPHVAVEEVPPINLNLIRPDVVYGEVPIRPREKNEPQQSVPHGSKRTHSRTASDSSRQIEKHHDSSSSCFGKRLGSLKKTNKEDAYESRTYTYPKSNKGQEQKFNRSLPRTHKLQEDNTFSAKNYVSDRNLSLKPDSGEFKDRSYEMIYCPQTVTDVHYAQNRLLDDHMYQGAHAKNYKLIKQNSLTSADKKAMKQRTDSCEKLFYLDSLKRADKVADSSTSKVKLKSAIQYTPMSLPLNQDQKGKLNPKFAFELNLDEKTAKSGKLKQLFSKQGESKKEKTFLGSPKLHRAIFRKSVSSDASWHPNSPQPIPLEDSYATDSPAAGSNNRETCNIHQQNNSPPSDYPDLEYPPVFEPETYSLADPQSSLSLLRKQTKTSNNNINNNQ